MRRVNNSLRCKPATIQIGSFLPDRHCEDYPKIQDSSASIFILKFDGGKSKGSGHRGGT